MRGYVSGFGDVLGAFVVPLVTSRSAPQNWSINGE